MIRIDAHQHFWVFDPVRDAWIDDTMKVIQRDFLPQDLAPLLVENNIDGCIAVQADQSETETQFLLDLAAKSSIIKGVVGWVDLVAENVSERLAHFAKNPLFKGIRHIAQGEADDFLLRSDVQNGISQLSKLGLTYDILVFQHQLPAAIELVRQFPNQAFVLDHIAKPQISKGIDENWKANMLKLATFPNVSCKLSGMVTEATNFQWTKEEFSPFIEIVFEAFGTDRILYGSDWPVCLLAANYKNQLEIVQNYISTLAETEQAKVMGNNAAKFYKIK